METTTENHTEETPERTDITLGEPENLGIEV